MANPTPQEVREAAQKVIAEHISERPGICAQPHGGDFRATWPCGELIQARNALAMADEVDRQKDRVQGYYNEAATAYEKLQVVEAERKAMAEAVENLWARLNAADPTGDFGGKGVTLAPAPAAPKPCPTCGSTDPRMHPRPEPLEDEVDICPDHFHAPRDGKGE